MTAKHLAQGNIQKTIMALLLPVALLLIGWQNVFAASITTDQLDYPPFMDVHVSGTGFAPNENVELQLKMQNTDGSWTDVASTTDWPNPWTVIADANGNISDEWNVWSEDFYGVSFLLSAAGQISGLVAETRFTDALSIASVSPNSGPIAGGTSVTITGAGFTSGQAPFGVTFGGTPATFVTRVITPP
jgi:hypothetical protein